MKKLVLVMFLLFAATPAKALFPVIDIAAIAQTITINLNIISKIESSVSQWKAIETARQVIGSVKKGLKKLADLKEEIDEYIALFAMGTQLINESIAIANENLNNVELAKQLLLEPLRLVEEAQVFSQEAINFMTSADDYAKRYEETLSESKRLAASPDPSLIRKSQELMVQAAELNRIHQDYLWQAQSVSYKADMLLYDVQMLDNRMQALNRKIIRDQERACMLAVKGMQYKSILQRKFCKNPVPGVVANPETYCDDQMLERGDSAQGVADVCSSKAQDAFKRIYGDEQ